MVPKVEEMNMPVEVAAAVGLMIELVLTMQWQVALAVMTTVAEVVKVQVKAAAAVGLIGHLE